MAITGTGSLRPLNMSAIEATNRGQADMEWAMLMSAAPVREVDINELETRAPEVVVLDVREPQEFASGHVPQPAMCLRPILPVV
jgi:hypothetical protein